MKRPMRLKSREKVFFTSPTQWTAGSSGSILEQSLEMELLPLHDGGERR